jgi:hypothetical protein
MPHLHKRGRPRSRFAKATRHTFARWRSIWFCEVRPSCHTFSSARAAEFVLRNATLMPHLLERGCCRVRFANCSLDATLFREAIRFAKGDPEPHPSRMGALPSSFCAPQPRIPRRSAGHNRSECAIASESSPRAPQVTEFGGTDRRQPKRQGNRHCERSEANQPHVRFLDGFVANAPRHDALGPPLSSDSQSLRAHIVSNETGTRKGARRGNSSSARAVPSSRRRPSVKNGAL